jgi:hypothetical protein
MVFFSSGLRILLNKGQELQKGGLAMTFWKAVGFALIVLLSGVVLYYSVTTD